MSMTREEAIKVLNNFPIDFRRSGGFEAMEALKIAILALRPVSREQVEQVWSGCEKCRNQANWPSWIEKGFVYCPKCGTPLTSWAWEKQVERLEVLKDGDLE